MKRAIPMAMAVVTLCAALTACGSNTRTDTRASTRARNRNTTAYRGNVSTTRNGTVNGTNDDLDTVLDLEW